MGERRVEYMRLADLREAPRNPKNHDEDGLAVAVDEFGFAELPLVDDRTGLLVAGHGRRKTLIAKRDAGEEPPDGIRIAADGEWLVPVNRGWESASDAAAEAYLAASNHLSAKGGWDEGQLAAMLRDVNAADTALFTATGFDEKMLREPEILPDALGPGDSGGSTGARPAVATAIGDVYALGRHRLMCGDATDPGHVDRLVAALGTEPDLVHTASPRVDDDDQQQPAGDVYRYLTALVPEALHVWWGAHRYAAAAGMPDSGCWLVRDLKPRPGDDEAELAWTSHDSTRIRRYPGAAPKKATGRPPRTDELAAWSLDAVDKDRFRQHVLDPFAGGGWTLMAAHTTNRTCAALDLDPARVDALCARFQRETGIKPERLHDDGTREVIDFA